MGGTWSAIVEVMASKDDLVINYYVHPTMVRPREVSDLGGRQQEKLYDVVGDKYHEFLDPDRILNGTGRRHPSRSGLPDHVLSEHASKDARCIVVRRPPPNYLYGDYTLCYIFFVCYKNTETYLVPAHTNWLGIHHQLVMFAKASPETTVWHKWNMRGFRMDINWPDVFRELGWTDAFIRDF